MDLKGTHSFCKLPPQAKQPYCFLSPAESSARCCGWDLRLLACATPPRKEQGAATGSLLHTEKRQSTQLARGHPLHVPSAQQRPQPRVRERFSCRMRMLFWHPEVQEPGRDPVVTHVYPPAGGRVRTQNTSSSSSISPILAGAPTEQGANTGHQCGNFLFSEKRILHFPVQHSLTCIAAAARNLRLTGCTTRYSFANVSSASCQAGRPQRLTCSHPHETS